MRKHSVFLIILLFPLALRSQIKLKETEIPFHPYTVRFNVFGLFDILDGNISGGIEYAFEPRWSLTADVGAILYSAYISKSKRALGYSFKPGIRYYVTDRRRAFIEAGAFYKRVGYKTTDWLQRGLVNGTPSYEELTDFIYRKRALGFHFISGIKLKLNQKETLWLELYGGLSVRMKWQDVKGFPDAAYRRNNSLLNNSRNDYAVLPGVPFGLRLSFEITE